MSDLSHFYHNTVSPVDHVSRVVYRHGFIDSFEWADGLDELASLNDAQIEKIAAADAKCGAKTPLSNPPPHLGWDKLSTYILLRLKGLDRISALREVMA